MEEIGAYHEKELLDAIARDDHEAYRRLYILWHKRIYSYIFAITAQNVLAEEGTQEVFITIWQQRNKLKEILNFEAWIFVIVRRHTLNLLRKIATDKKLLEQLEDLMSKKDMSVSDNAAESSERRTMVKKAISLLPAQQKRVYELSHLEGLTRNEIALQLNISPNTVKNHLNAAIMALRAYFNQRLAN